MERSAMEDAVETEIELPEALFLSAEELAAEMQISRSELYALALEDFIRRIENAGDEDAG